MTRSGSGRRTTDGNLSEKAIWAGGTVRSLSAGRGVGRLPFLWGYLGTNKLGIGESSAFVAAVAVAPGQPLLLALPPLTGRPSGPRLWRSQRLWVSYRAALSRDSPRGVGDGRRGATMRAILGSSGCSCGWVFLGERLRGGQWLSVSLGLVGLVLIIEPWELRGVLSSLLT